MRSSLIALVVGAGCVLGAMVIAPGYELLNPIDYLALAFVGGIPALICWLVLRVVTLAREVLK